MFQLYFSYYLQPNTVATDGVARTLYQMLFMCHPTYLHSILVRYRMLPGGNYGLEDNSPCLSRAASELPCTGLDGGLPYSTPYILRTMGNKNKIALKLSLLGAMSLSKLRTQGCIIQYVIYNTQQQMSLNKKRIGEDLPCQVTTN